MKDVIRIDGIYYDTARLARIHPGGELMVLISNRQDGTAMFNSSHRRSFPHEKYSEYVVPQDQVDVDCRLPPITQSFKLYFEICDKVRPILGKGFAPLWYYAKVFVLLSAVFALDVYSVLYRRSYALTMIQSVLMGSIGLNIQHDGNHGAASSNPLINTLLGMTQDFLGGSSISWMVHHNTIHHVHCNDITKDKDLEIPLLRLHPRVPHRAHFVLQQFYFLLIEALFGPLHVIQAFVWLWSTPEPRLQILAPYFTISRCVSMIAPVRLLIAMLQCNGDFTYVLATTFLQYSLGGLYLAFFFTMSHNFAGVRKEDVNSTLDCFVKNQAETSSNVGGSWLAHLNGGLNYQIEHHLFPRVHHSFYAKIAPVVREICKKNKIGYTHFPTIADNLTSTFDHLAELGRSKGKKL